MGYEVEVDFSPAYELIISLYTYIHQKSVKQLELGKQWVRSTRSELSTQFASELDDERLEVFHRLSLLVWQCPGEREIPQFLQWLQELPSDELYERMIPWVQVLPTGMNEMRQRAVYLLSEWNKQYFSKLDPAILHTLRSDAEKKREQLPVAHFDELIEQATNGIKIEYSESIHKVILAPQYHCSPYTIKDYFQGLITCLYPVDIFSEGEVPPVVLRQAHALADRHRIAILRFLYKEPRTFTDIVKHTGLAKSNVHYHINALRLGGFIRAHHSSQRAEFYSFRETPFHQMNCTLLSHLKGD